MGQDTMGMATDQARSSGQSQPKTSGTAAVVSVAAAGASFTQVLHPVLSYVELSLSTLSSLAGRVFCDALAWVKPSCAMLHTLCPDTVVTALCGRLEETLDTAPIKS